MKIIYIDYNECLSVERRSFLKPSKTVVVLDVQASDIVSL